MPKNPHEKAIQRALMQYKNPANRALVLEGLKMADRMDLVGFGPKCLIRPERGAHAQQNSHAGQGKGRNAQADKHAVQGKERNAQVDKCAGQGRKAQPDKRAVQGKASAPASRKNTIRNVHKKKR